jgi:hypothetical protein
MESRDADQVMDLLYEEDSAAATAGDTEVVRLRELRGVMREFRDATDAEPSGNMAILMAAARARRPEPAGLWARLGRWFSAVAMHPALAAAATVVVVGGVAGALYVRGRGGVVEPTAEQAPPSVATGQGSMPAPDRAPTSAMTPGGEKAGSGSGSAAVFETAEVQPKVQVEDTGRGGPSAADPMPAIAPHAPGHPHGTAPAKPAPAVGDTGGAKPDNFAPESDDADGVIAGEQAATRFADRQGVASDEAKNQASGAAAPSEAPVVAAQGASPPPPPRAPAPTTPPMPTSMPGGSAGAGGGGTSVDKPKKAPAPPKGTKEAAALTDQARVAARRRDCKTVGALAGRVRVLDSAYYRDNFAPDGDIKQCTAAPAADLAK